MDETEGQSIEPGISIVNIRVLVAPQIYFRCCDIGSNCAVALGAGGAVL